MLQLVEPMYCLWHLQQLTTYTTLELEQLKALLCLMEVPVAVMWTMSPVIAFGQMPQMGSSTGRLEGIVIMVITN